MHTVCFRVIEAGRRRVHTCTIFLHDAARDDVLEGLAELAELGHAAFADPVDPLRDHTLVVILIFEELLGHRVDNTFHLLRDKRRLL